MTWQLTSFTPEPTVSRGPVDLRSSRSDATRRVLIISPHFPPTNAPDHQRVRLALPHFAELAWHPTVLAVRPEDVEAPRDEWLLETIPADVEVRRVAAPRSWHSWWIGARTLSRRALPPLRAAGTQLLKDGSFDLIYFSTTQFGVHRLGPLWQRAFGIPFVIDLQDPWVNDYYSRNPHVIPPGGRFKFEIAQRQAVRDERRCLIDCAAVTSVSPEYISNVIARNPGLSPDKCTVLPFGAAEQDFDRLRRRPVEQTYYAPRDGLEHWVYVGRGGRDLWPAARLLFTGFRAALAANPGRYHRVRMHFLGTDYSPPSRAQPTLQPLATELGIGEFVQEVPQRLPYSQALQCLLDADRLMILGSDDPGYSPSKAAPYLLARKPLLAILHRNSPVHALLSRAGACCVSWSADGSTAEDGCLPRWLCDSAWTVSPLPASVIDEVSARGMTARLVATFNQALSQRDQSSLPDDATVPRPFDRAASSHNDR